MIRWFVPLVALAACTSPARRPPEPPPPAARCALPADPVVLRRDGPAVLLRWDLADDPVLHGDTLPDAPDYLAFRAAIRDAGGDLARPVQDPPAPANDREREAWRREDANRAVAHDGGMVRPINCLEAALFAYQHARYSQLTHPTELTATILRRGDRLRVYAGSSDQMFPPKAFYTLDEARADVAAGWQLLTIFHNHTVVTNAGKPALGTPAPSTNDVHLFRNVLEDTPFVDIRVTNGMYTGVVPAARLADFHGPPD